SRKFFLAVRIEKIKPCFILHELRPTTGVIEDKPIFAQRAINLPKVRKRLRIAAANRFGWDRMATLSHAFFNAPYIFLDIVEKNKINRDFITSTDRLLKDRMPGFPGKSRFKSETLAFSDGFFDG